MEPDSEPGAVWLSVAFWRLVVYERTYRFRVGSGGHNRKGSEASPPNP